MTALYLIGCTPALAQQGHANLDWNPQNLVPYGASVISPDVHNDRTVTFRPKAPAVRQVTLTSGPILLAFSTKNPTPFQLDNDSF